MRYVLLVAYSHRINGYILESNLKANRRGYIVAMKKFDKEGIKFVYLRFVKNKSLLRDTCIIPKFQRPLCT